MKTEHTARTSRRNELISPGTLAAANPGERVLCRSVSQAGTLSQRLQDLGLTEGTVLLCERRSLLGDPTAYRIIPGGFDGTSSETGCVIALRRSDAGQILVDACPTASDGQKGRGTWG